jgi:hypothetical protein
VAYDNNQMSRSLFFWASWKRSRRSVLVTLLGSLSLVPRQQGDVLQEGQPPDERRPKLPELDDDPRLPDGKSQKNAIAKEQHEQALKDAEQLVAAAQDLRDQIKQAGTFVIPLSSVKKTEEIEKLAKRIRGRLKY